MPKARFRCQLELSCASLRPVPEVSEEEEGQEEGRRSAPSTGVTRTSRQVEGKFLVKCIYICTFPFVNWFLTFFVQTRLEESTNTNPLLRQEEQQPTEGFSVALHFEEISLQGRVLQLDCNDFGTSNSFPRRKYTLAVFDPPLRYP